MCVYGVVLRGRQACGLGHGRLVCRGGDRDTYVRPVERRTPARKAETWEVSQDVTEVLSV